MVDPAKRYNKLVEEEDARFRSRVGEHQAQIPAYSPQAQPLTRVEEEADYQATKLTPGGFAIRLKEEAKKFGKAKAVEDILDWGIRNERD